MNAAPQPSSPELRLPEMPFDSWKDTVGIGLFPNFFINVTNWSLGLVQGTQHMAGMLR